MPLILYDKIPLLFFLVEFFGGGLFIEKSCIVVLAKRLFLINTF